MDYSNRMSYSKLHSSVVNSSLWLEDYHTRVLFITLLAICDREGYVFGTRGGIQRIANISPEPPYSDGAVAWKPEHDPWKILLNPDVGGSGDAMRAPENEGRRIEEIPGGFHILNYAYYRDLKDAEDRRHQCREAQKRFREKRNTPSSGVINRNQALSKVSLSDADADAEAEKDISKSPTEISRPAGPDKPAIEGALKRIWDAAPPKARERSSRRECREALRLSKTTVGETDTIIDAVELWKQTEDWKGGFVPALHRWLRNRKWEDVPAHKETIEEKCARLSSQAKG